jgi:hypothetical protein
MTDKWILDMISDSAKFDAVKRKVLEILDSFPQYKLGVAIQLISDEIVQREKTGNILKEREAIISYLRKFEDHFENKNGNRLLFEKLVDSIENRIALPWTSDEIAHQLKKKGEPE